MKVRSPLLGYNHNIRYGGRLYHVQTEDSGVNNPHIFTHMFYEGTILASKRADYAAGDEDATVRGLMQVQHKGMLKDLRDGVYDAKISSFFGDPVPASAPAPVEDAPPPEEIAAAAPNPQPTPMFAGLPAHLLADALGLASDLEFDVPLDEVTQPLPRADEEITLSEATGPASLPAIPEPDFDVSHFPQAGAQQYDEADEQQYEQADPQHFGQGDDAFYPHPDESQYPSTVRNAFDLDPLPVGTPPPLPPPQLRFTPPRVAAVARKQQPQNPIVPRPMVVVGGPSARRNTPPPARANETSIFGDEPETDKSLDEVILAYLSEDTPKK